MTEQEAKEIIDKSPSYIDMDDASDDGTVVMDGRFSIEELEAVLTMARLTISEGHP